MVRFQDQKRGRHFGRARAQGPGGARDDPRPGSPARRRRPGRDDRAVARMPCPEMTTPKARRGKRTDGSVRERIRLWVSITAEPPSFECAIPTRRRFHLSHSSAGSVMVPRACHLHLFANARLSSRRLVLILNRRSTRLRTVPRSFHSNAAVEAAYKPCSCLDLCQSRRRGWPWEG
jgi:hypothetical protein